MQNKKTRDRALRTKVPNTSYNLIPRNRSGALEISFGWLFAIIAGIIIIFLAIYISSRFIGTSQQTTNAETGKEIGILLDPLETSFESAQVTSITIPVETRINNMCDNATGSFGRQLIQLDQLSFGKWTKTNVAVNFENKYIFSNAGIEGKKFYIFSKPFNFPFKIADLIYMTSSSDIYCFRDIPSDSGIEDELSSLKQGNILIENSTLKCSDSDIKVCFNNDNCEINVGYDSGTVEKDGKTMYFDDGDTALMYAGIFSNKDVYECQLKRLMMRLKEISSLYANKDLINKIEECNNDIRGDLNDLSELAGSFSSSDEIATILRNKADIIEEKNSPARCPLW